MANDKSNVWHLILHESVMITREAVLAYCNATPAVKLCSYEIADEKVKRPHYHIAHLYDTETCRSTLQRQMKKIIPGVKGITDYTTHLPKENETIDGLYDYLCKGSINDINSVPDIVYKCSIFTDKFIQDSHLRFHLRQQEFRSETKALAKKKDNEKIKKRSLVIAEAIIALKDIKHNQMFHIVEYIWTAYKGLISYHELTMMSTAVEYAQTPEQSINNAYEMVLSKIKPRH